MKKIFIIACAAVMAVSAAGCSKKADSSDTDTSSKKASQTPGDPKVPEIEKSVIWETDNIRVSTEYFKRVNAGLKIKIENKSGSDLELRTLNSSFYVNDFVMSGWVYCDVPAGEALYDTIDFDSSVISDGDIREIGKAEFYLIASYDDDSIETERSDKIVVESDPDGWKEQKAPEGQLLYDAGGIKIIAREIADYPRTNILPVYIENNSGQEIDAKFTWAKVNGENVDLLSKRNHCLIPDGKRIITRIDVEEIMEESGDDSLESLKINFDIDIGETDELRTEYLLIKDISGYTKSTSKTKENKEEDQK